MDGKKIKIITIVSLSLVAFSLIATWLTMRLALFSKALPNYEDIDNTCGTILISVFALFALGVKAINLFISGLSCIAKKRRLSIVTASIFACIISALSAIVGVLTFASFVQLAGTDGYAVLVGCVLLLMPLTDLFCVVVAIYRAVKLSKMAKLSVG